MRFKSSTFAPFKMHFFTSSKISLLFLAASSLAFCSCERLSSSHETSSDLSELSSSPQPEDLTLQSLPHLHEKNGTIHASPALFISSLFDVVTQTERGLSVQSTSAWNLHKKWRELNILYCPAVFGYFLDPPGNPPRGAFFPTADPS